MDSAHRREDRRRQALGALGHHRHPLVRHSNSRQVQDLEVRRHQWAQEWAAGLYEAPSILLQVVALEDRREVL